MSENAKFLLKLRKTKKASKQEFILQQRPRASNEGSSVTTEVPNGLNQKGLNKGSGVTPSVSDDPSGSLSNSSLNYDDEIKDISSNEENDGATNKEKQPKNIQAKESVPEPQAEQPAVPHPSSSQTLSSAEFNLLEATDKDQRRTAPILKEIDKTLLTRLIMRSLECFEGDDLFLFARGHPNYVHVIMHALEEFNNVSDLVLSSLPVRSLSGMDIMPPHLADVMEFLIPISKGHLVVSVISRLLLAATSYFLRSDCNSRLFKKNSSTLPQIIKVITAIVRLKLVTFKFKKVSTRVRIILDTWKIQYDMDWDQVSQDELFKGPTLSVLEAVDEAIQEHNDGLPSISEGQFHNLNQANGNSEHPVSQHAPTLLETTTEESHTPRAPRPRPQIKPKGKSERISKKRKFNYPEDGTGKTPDKPFSL
ncbi:hypothetical protein Tco_1317891 [Tanacetum coccineum]